MDMIVRKENLSKVEFGVQSMWFQNPILMYEMVFKGLAAYVISVII